jgi:ABC-type multidrug transport system fused ATPase/permease subunit
VLSVSKREDVIFIPTPIRIAFRDREALSEASVPDMTGGGIASTWPRWRARSAGASSADLSGGLFRYIMATSWQHQLPLLLLTVGVFLLEVVPLELQRRIVNDVVKQRSYGAVVLLCGAYVGAVFLQGSTKLGLNIYRSWVGEHAKRDLRWQVCESTASAGAAAPIPEAQGTAVAMIVAEVEPIGGFIGEAVSEPLLQAGVLATIIAYIIHLDAWMAAAALALFLPQLVFVPLMQHAMNRRTGARVWLLRQIGAGLIAGTPRQESSAAMDEGRIERVFRLDMRIFQLKFTMNFLMNLCSHLQIVAALLLGAWWVLHEQLEIGGVVAFISGIGWFNDPWGDLVNYFRELSVTRVKFQLLADAATASTLADYHRGS